MKRIICCIVTITLVLCVSPVPTHAQDGSNYQAPGTGEVKSVKTLQQADQEQGQPEEQTPAPPSTPLNTSTSGGNAIGHTTNEPEVTQVVYGQKDTSKFLFMQSLLQRLQHNQPSVVTPPAIQPEPPKVEPTPEPVAPTEVSGTVSEVPAAVPSPVTPTPVEVSPAPAAQPAPTTTGQTTPPSSPVVHPPDLDRKTADLLPSIILAADVRSVAEKPPVSAGAASMTAKTPTAPKEERLGNVPREENRPMKQEGAAVERAAGLAASKTSLLTGEQPAETGWFDALQTRVNRNNISDMPGGGLDSSQTCVSFANTDGIAKMIERSEQKAEISGQNQKNLYAYGQDENNIVFITVIELDSADQPVKAGRLFADGRIQAFSQLKRDELKGTAASKKGNSAAETLFTKMTDSEQGLGYRITGLLKSETVSQFYLDKTRGAVRAPCPKAISKK